MTPTISARRSGLPPGPRGLSAYRFLGWGSSARALGFLQATARTYGPISSLRIFNQHLTLVDDADLIEQILVRDQHKFVRDRGAVLLRELVGDGLLTSDEPRHRERRRVIQPAFHRAQIASYAEAMEQEAEQCVEEWHAGDRINIGAEMRRLTLKIVGRALFGVDFTESAARVAQLLERAFRRSALIAVLLPIFEPALVRYRKLRPKAASVFYAKERAELERIIQPILECRSRQSGTGRNDVRIPGLTAGAGCERRAALQPAFSPACQGGDVVSLLLEYGLTGEDVYNELVTLVLAGHETTATALTWAWYLISQHPEVEHRLHREAGRGESGREYISMVFHEVLRLYPPVPAFGRRPTEPIELGGYTIPPGASVIVSPYITQRNERYFENPEQFQPERWCGHQPPKLAYFPFGAGAKMCIGDAFAKLEGITVLAAVARRWRLRLTDASPMDIRPGITLAPARKIWMEVVPQRGAAGC
jgi:cytochrome P450